MNYSKILTTACLIPLFLMSCLDDSESESSKYQKMIDEQISKHIETNHIEAIKSNYGFYYEKLQTNASGKVPATGEVMLVKYLIKKLNGDLIESKMDEISLFKYDLNSVVPYGAVYGLKEMKTGEKIRLYIPAYMAYESYGTEKFGPDTNFILEMELVGTKTETQINAIEIDSITSYIAKEEIEDIASFTPGLYYKALTEGTGDKPLDYNKVKFHFVRKYLDGTISQQTEQTKPIEVYLNQSNMVTGLRQGILKMKKGETALLIMPSELGFGASLHIMPDNVRSELYDEKVISNNVKPYSPIIYEVQLLDVTN